MSAGFKLSVDMYYVFSRRLYFAGEFDSRATRLFRAILRPGDTVIDGGANIGYFSLLSARCVGATGHVHAFEPMPETYSSLSKNVELNGEQRVNHRKPNRPLRH